MTEDKKVITIDDVEYTEDQLSDTAKHVHKSHQLARPEDRLCAV
jgi:hypothetical protein